MKVKTERREESNGSWFITSFNEEGKVIGYTDSNGDKILKTYLPNGNLNTSDTNGIISFFEYDEEGTLSRIKTRDSNNTESPDKEASVVWDENSENTVSMSEDGIITCKITVTVDGDNKIVHTERGEYWETSTYQLENLIAFRNSLGEDSKREYNENGLLVRTEENGVVSTFEYKNGFLVSELVGDVLAEYEYNDVGNLHTIKENGELVITYEYNEHGLLAETLTPDGTRSVIEYEYY